MSTLNLVPNPTVMVAQGVIFFTYFYVIKKLLLEPYLEVYKKRQGATVGGSETANRIDQENTASEKKITSAISEAQIAANDMKLSLKTKADQTRTDLISVAEKEAKSTLESIRKEISDMVAAEKPKLPSTVNKLADVIFVKLTEGH